MHTAPRTIVFDLDGTLMDTSGDLLAAANACFRAMGHGDVLLRGRDDGAALKGAKSMLRAGLAHLGHPDETVVDRWYLPLIEAYDGAIDLHTTIYPGAMEAVAALRANGHRLAICTNKPERLAVKLVASMGVADAFDALIGADTLSVRKPDAAPLIEAVRRAGGDAGHACLVGDTRTDRDTATAAQVPCILVGFGPGADDMAALRPDAIIAHFDDLMAAVAALDRSA